MGSVSQSQTRVDSRLQAGNRASVICKFVDQVSVLLQFPLPISYVARLLFTR